MLLADGRPIADGAGRRGARRRLVLRDRDRADRVLRRRRRRPRRLITPEQGGDSAARPDDDRRSRRDAGSSRRSLVLGRRARRRLHLVRALAPVVADARARRDARRARRARADRLRAAAERQADDRHRPDRRLRARRRARLRRRRRRRARVEPRLRPGPVDAVADGRRGDCCGVARRRARRARPAAAWAGSRSRSPAAPPGCSFGAIMDSSSGSRTAGQQNARAVTWRDLARPRCRSTSPTRSATSSSASPSGRCSCARCCATARGSRSAGRRRRAPAGARGPLALLVAHRAGRPRRRRARPAAAALAGWSARPERRRRLRRGPGRSARTRAVPAWTVIGLAAAGAPRRRACARYAGRSARRALRDAGDIERTILGLAAQRALAAALSPRTATSSARLRRAQRRDGSFSRLVNRTSFADPRAARRRPQRARSPRSVAPRAGSAGRPEPRRRLQLLRPRRPSGIDDTAGAVQALASARSRRASTVRARRASWLARTRTATAATPLQPPGGLERAVDRARGPGRCSRPDAIRRASAPRRSALRRSPSCARCSSRNGSSATRRTSAQTPVWVTAQALAGARPAGALSRSRSRWLGSATRCRLAVPKETAHRRAPRRARPRGRAQALSGTRHRGRRRARRGRGALIPDAAFTDAGAQVTIDATASGAPTWSSRSRRRPPRRSRRLREGALLVGFLQPLTQRRDADAPRATPSVTAFAMEAIPRISRAQSMDALSSQANVAGYKAALLARRAPATRFFPMLMTAAGTIPPAKVLVLGAGVAGLQALATARRLGASDDRLRRAPRGRRAGRSRSAPSWLDLGIEAAGEGGYARELTDEEQAAAAAGADRRDQGLRRRHHDRARARPPGAEARHRRGRRGHEARQRDRRPRRRGGRQLRADRARADRGQARRHDRLAR